MRFIAGGLGGLVVLVDIQRCDQSVVLCWLALGDRGTLSALPDSSMPTELTWTTTLVGVWVNCAKVSSPWKMPVWPPRLATMVV